MVKARDQPIMLAHQRGAIPEFRTGDRRLGRRMSFWFVRLSIVCGELRAPPRTRYRKLLARRTDRRFPAGRYYRVIGFCSAIIVLRALLAATRAEHALDRFGGGFAADDGCGKPMMDYYTRQRVSGEQTGSGDSASSVGRGSFSSPLEGWRDSGRSGRGARAMTVSGVADLAAVPEHVLCIHLGSPTLVNCRLGDLVQKGRRQVRGDMDIVPVGSSISWETEEDAPLLLLQVSPVALASAAAQLGLDPCQAVLAPQLQVRDTPLERILMAMESTLLAGGSIDPLLFDSLSLAATVRLLQRFADAPPPRPLQALAPRKLRRVLEHVEAHLGERLSVARLAEIAGASPSHFAALFRRSTGESVHQYVLGRRVERARTLLMVDGVSISQTALEAGFAHQSHMASCLKRALGLTPRELAKLGDEAITSSP